MRLSLGFIALLFLVACGGSEDDAPTGSAVADFHGTWETVAMLEGTPEPVPVTLEGSPDGWTMTLTDREPVMLRASMSGDSLVTESDPYESILRSGVTVRVRTAGVLRDGRLVGTMRAVYTTPNGEETVSGTIEGRRTGAM